MAHQIFGQMQRRGVQPLQVVEKQDERMLRTGKNAEEAPENGIEAVLRVLGRHFRDRRLFADECDEIGDKIGNERPFGPTASCTASRHRAISSSPLPRTWRTRACIAWASVA